MNQHIKWNFALAADLNTPTKEKATLFNCCVKFESEMNEKH